MSAPLLASAAQSAGALLSSVDALLSVCEDDADARELKVLRAFIATGDLTGMLAALELDPSLLAATAEEAEEAEEGRVGGPRVPILYGADGTETAWYWY